MSAWMFLPYDSFATSAVCSGPWNARRVRACSATDALPDPTRVARAMALCCAGSQQESWEAKMAARTGVVALAASLDRSCILLARHEKTEFTAAPVTSTRQTKVTFQPMCGHLDAVRRFASHATAAVGLSQLSHSTENSDSAASWHKITGRPETVRPCSPQTSNERVMSGTDGVVRNRKCPSPSPVVFKAWVATG